jgi:hypothetical protein
MIMVASLSFLREITRTGEPGGVQMLVNLEASRSISGA